MVATVEPITDETPPEKPKPHGGRPKARGRRAQVPEPTAPEPQPTVPPAPRSVAEMSVEEIQAEIDRRKAAQQQAMPQQAVPIPQPPQPPPVPPGTPQIGGSVQDALAQYRGAFQAIPVPGAPGYAAPMPPDPDQLFAQGRDVPPAAMVDPHQAFRALSQPPPLNPYQATVTWNVPQPAQPSLDAEGNLVAPPLLPPTAPHPPRPVDPGADLGAYVEITLPGGVRGRVRRDAIQLDPAATPVPADPGQANYRCMIGGTNERTGHPDFYADPALAQNGVYIQCPVCGSKTVQPLF